MIYDQKDDFINTNPTVLKDVILNHFKTRGVFADTLKLNREYSQFGEADFDLAHLFHWRVEGWLSGVIQKFMTALGDQT